MLFRSVTGATENDGNITIGDAATDTITFGGTIQGSLVFGSEERRVGKECRSRGSPYH